MSIKVTETPQRNCCWGQSGRFGHYSLMSLMSLITSYGAQLRKCLVADL